MAKTGNAHLQKVICKSDFYFRCTFINDWMWWMEIFFQKASTIIWVTIKIYFSIQAAIASIQSEVKSKIEQVNVPDFLKKIICNKEYSQ